MAQNAQHTVVSVDRVIKAPAATLFAVVADATRHPEIDGSGQLVKAKDGAAQHLALGSTFRHVDEDGGAVLRVQHRDRVRAGPPHRLADRDGGTAGSLLGGRIWRYELEPVDGGTKVTETWDIREDKQAFFLKSPKIGQHTAASMSKSLDRLAGITES